jgi:hypothetical protein
VTSCCTACGTVIPELDELAQLRQRADALEVELALAEKDLRGKRSVISRLRGERNNQHQLSPFADQAREWFDHWNTVCRKGKAREFGADRFEPAVDRIAAGHTLEDWEEAVEGARRLLAGQTKFRPDNPTSYTEMKNIAKDETSLQRFKEYAQTPVSNVVQLRPAPDLSGFPQLGVWLEGRILGDCPSCGQAGRVTPKRDGLGLFECFGRCDGGSGVYRLVGLDAPMVAALNGGAA